MPTRALGPLFRPLCRARGLLVLVLLVALAASAGPASAQRSGNTPRQVEGVGVDQKLGEQIPTGLSFKNEQGETVSLGRYFDGSTPVILTLNYHTCPMLCGLQLQGFAEGIDGMDWVPGDKFRVVTVDINPRETPEVARQAQARYVATMSPKEPIKNGWHFLTGRKAAIDSLAGAVGFSYKWLEDTKQYAHPTAVIIASGSGTITRYLTTLEPDPGAMRTALVEASDGEVGSVVDQVFLACSQFDPDSNSYTANAFAVMKYISIGLAVLMGGVLLFFWRRESEALDAAAASEGDVDAALDEMDPDDLDDALDASGRT
jgi:protein SCO1/2